MVTLSYITSMIATVLGLIFTSFSAILGIIVAAAGIGFIVFLNKKGEILFKNAVIFYFCSIDEGGKVISI